MTTTSDMQPHVFVSYSRSNREMMQRVSQTLSEANIPVWTDEKLTAGTQSWKNTIEYALQGAFCVVVLMSPTAKRSEWVERELDYAYMLQRPIYPVLVEGSQRDSVPFELINMQYIDARADFDQSMKQLIGLLAPFVGAPYSVAQTPAVTIDTHRPEPLPPMRPVPPEPISSIGSAMPSLLDIVAYRFGFNRDDGGVTARYASRSRRLLRWYFLEPRKFRLFSALTQDSSGRLIHASVTTLAYLWLFLPGSLLVGLFSPVYLLGSLLLLLPFCYGILVLIPMATPYKSRRAFFGSIFYGLLLVGLLSVVLVTSYALMQALSQALRAL